MSQVQNLITEHLETWTQAIEAKSSAGRGSSNKFTLVGIKKLRELILEMAVRGLLVPQDPSDEPASVLLEKIAAEKAQLIKDKKIKKTKPLPVISEDEQPFDLPNGWELVRLNEIGDWGAGATPKRGNSEYYNGNIPWFKSGELIADFISETEEKITERALKECSLRLNQPGDVLIAMYGATIGKTSILKVGGTTNQAVCACTTFSGVLNRFLLLLLKAFKSRFTDMGAGGAQPNISKVKIVATVIALPPFEEQKRIVAKVNELMVLCDQLESQTLGSISTHQTLVETLLGNLVNPENTANFDQVWSLIAQNFDVLFTTEHSIDTLKQTILQLAVMGKLVPQDPTDEPASKLLEKIATEKAQLIKDKKIKKTKPLPEITEDEKPFDLPNGWSWTRIVDLALIGTGATPSRSEISYFQPPEFNWVTSGETSQDYIYETTEKVSAKALNETNVSIYPEGTLIVAMYGQGKTRGQITELKVKAGTNQACAAIQLIKEEDSHREYIKNCFKKAYEEIRSGAAGGAQPNLNVGKISSTVLPLPPLEEQARIVAKVNELMDLCDQLKTELQTAQQTQTLLAESIAREAMA